MWRFDNHLQEKFFLLQSKKVNSFLFETNSKTKSIFIRIVFIPSQNIISVRGSLLNGDRRGNRENSSGSYGTFR